MIQGREAMKSFRGISLLLVPLFILLCACSRNSPPSFWPRNGVRFEDVTWDVPLADSASVLIEKNGQWKLPDPPDGIPLKIEITLHRKPDGKPYKKLIGRIDQETFRADGPMLHEFYRFTKKGALLLGYEGSDSKKLLTIFDPPLVMVPPDPGSLDSELVNSSKSKTWDSKADTFMQNQMTRLRLKRIRRGTVSIDAAVRPAVLCTMSLSQDRMIGFGGTGLIVPDAVMLESRILFVEGIGPVLEWGIRSREKMETQHEGGIPPGPGPERPHAVELFIEVTLHRMVEIEH
jgi:hypothetical protein